MPETFIKNNRYGDRVKKAFVGIILGLVLFIGSFVLLSWNEHRSIKEQMKLDLGMETVISVDADAPQPQNNGKLVHFSGITRGADVLSDKDFGISKETVALKRKVEMYQWEEEERTKNNETHYTYDKKWKEGHIDSRRFEYPDDYTNPDSIPYNSYINRTRSLMLEGFKLSGNAIEKISGWQDVPLANISVPAGYTIYGQYIHSGEFSNPNIGDIRISFQSIPYGGLSVVGKQNVGILGEYPTKYGELLLVSNGIKTADEVFQEAYNKNTMMTWGLRFGGFFMMFLGLKMITGILDAIVSFIPYLGNIIGAITDMLCVVLAFVLSLITIALAWFAVRPLLSLTIIGIGIVVFMLFLNRKKAAVKQI